MKTQQEYKDKVRETLERWVETQLGALPNETEVEHIVHTGASVLMTRDGGPQGGSFVQAIVDNDLSRTHNRADSTNTRFIPFYILLLNHINP